MNNKLYFVTAVLNTIREFTMNYQSFSARDITHRLRERVNGEDFGFSDAEQEQDVFDGEFRYLVRHNQVRDVVHELWETDHIGANYFRKPQRNDDGLSYMVYFPLLSASVNVTQPTDDVRGSDSSSTCKPSNPDPSSSSGPCGKYQRKPVGPVQLKSVVRDYIGRKRTKNEPITMKAIQSRLKGTKISISDIATTVWELGLKVRPQANKKASLALVW